MPYIHKNFISTVGQCSAYILMHTNMNDNFLYEIEKSCEWFEVYMYIAENIKEI